MPFSTNAPFNEKGHAEALRDIEYLYLKLQELFQQLGVSDGDLNPGGGVGVSQLIPDDAWGSAPDSADSAAASGGTARTSIYLCGTGQNIAGGADAAITHLTNGALDPGELQGWDPATGTFTAPENGVYLFELQASFDIFAAGYIGVYFNAAATALGHQQVNVDPAIVGTPGAQLSTCLCRRLVQGQTVVAHAFNINAGFALATLSSGHISITRL